MSDGRRETHGRENVKPRGCLPLNRPGDRPRHGGTWLWREQPTSSGAARNNSTVTCDTQAVATHKTSNPFNASRLTI